MTVFRIEKIHAFAVQAPIKISFKMHSLLARVFTLSLLGLTLPAALCADANASHSLPSIEKHGAVSQLTVEGKPYLILGGELLNSSSSNLDYMEPIWSRLSATHLNTVLAGVSWELVEPEEGHFDFRLVDGLIRDARAHELHLVFLWFASWKNGMSSYPPIWVKRDPHRFPRAKIAGSETGGVLSVFAPSNAEADARAFSALMKHLREIDTEHTVLMTQVENEVGILGDSRDRSDLAEKSFNGPVPNALMQYLADHSATLGPELKTQWGGLGNRTAGTWTEVFGPGLATDELFMAWYYARYVDHVAQAGKKMYPIPLYANAWLNEPTATPGNYPSGGPLAQVLDVWKAAAPNLDLLAPDLYAADYEERCEKFTRGGNLLFIPEMQRGEDGARNVFIAVGGFHALGVSPFAIDAPAGPMGKGNDALGKSYDLLAQLTPQILQQQQSGNVIGFALNKEHPSLTSHLNGYELAISLDEIFGHQATEGAGIIIANGPDQFIGAGAGFRVAFRPETAGPPLAGIGSVDEGVYRQGEWVPGRRLNGDEDDQGQKWRFSPFKPSIAHCLVYRHD